MRKYGTMIRGLLLVCLVLTTASGGAWARGLPLTGSVVEPNASKTPGAPGIMPAENVTVQLEGTDKSTTTDATGAFFFQNVPEGEITIVASKAGYLPTIKKYTLKGPMPGRVLVFLNPSGNMSAGGGGAPEVVRPDTVYVAFSTPIAAGPGGNPQAPLAGGPTTSLAVLGAIAGGADPLTMGGNAPTIPTGPNGYQTNVSGAPNQIMVLDPEKPTSVSYIESPARMFWLTFNEAGTKLFGSTDTNVINIYDTVNGNVLLQQIPVGGVVNDLVRVRSLLYAAVMRANGDGIMVIDPSRNAPIRIIPTPGLSSGGRAHPWSVTANNDGTRVYVAMGNERDGEVLALDAFTTRPVAVAKVGANPMGIAITPDNQFLLVTNSKAATVTVLDAFTLQPVAQVPVGLSPFHIAIRPDGAKAYVTCRASNSVYVINLQAKASGAVIPVGNNPMGIAVTSDGAHVYVANQGNGTVSQIDGNADTFVKNTTPQPRSRPYGVAVKP